MLPEKSKEFISDVWGKNESAIPALNPNHSQDGDCAVAPVPLQHLLLVIGNLDEARLMFVGCSSCNPHYRRR